MKNKKILLIGGNFSPEPTGIGKYNGEMINWLAANGYTCTVITTYPYYPYWKVQGNYSKGSFWYKRERVQSEGKGSVTILRCPHYVPRNPTGIRRILSDATFFLSAFFRLLPLLFTSRYDLVMTVVPAFHMGLLGLFYKKVKGAAFLYHIQDLQIEAAQQLGMISSKRALQLLYHTERMIVDGADLVSTISEGMLKKVQQKSKKPVCLFPNWVDTTLFYPIAEKGPLKEAYGFVPEDKIVLYSGAIGEKQGLESILYAAKALQQHRHLKFVICGSGPYKEKLEGLTRELSLSNVKFLPLQPFEKLNQFLNMADVHLVLQKADAADLVMPSKLTTILAIGGLSVVTAKEGTSLYDVVSSHDMGLVIEPEDQAVLNTSILQALDESNEKRKLNARTYAQKFIAIDGIFSHFLSEVNQSVFKLNTVKAISKSYVEETVL
ncbi:MAG TPA: WcaI family glycosyltransferase [Flavisolibacter sp.]|jgi:colanic acid biosynthesis glycosyl transferase WcaI|nr:WcaI family glycosyltransferase [Flavisolibacter sp.]